MKKVVFLGSKPIGYFCLNHILEQAKNLDIQIIGVFSNENKKFGGESFKSLCGQHQIPFYTEIKDLDLITDEIDFLISVQFHQILERKHLKRAKKRAINLHMAPVPEYRGCNQFSFAIYNRAESFGTTLHLMDEGIDSGDIIAERRFNIDAKIKVKDLLTLTVEESKILFTSNISKLFDLSFKPISQKGTGKTYYRKDIEKIKEIKLYDSEEVIELKMRATYMPGFEPPFFIVKNKKYHLTPEEDYSN